MKAGGFFPKAGVEVESPVVVRTFYVVSHPLPELYLNLRTLVSAQKTLGLLGYGYVGAGSLIITFASGYTEVWLCSQPLSRRMSPSSASHSPHVLPIKPL
jgi:hypothetical protein